MSAPHSFTFRPCRARSRRKAFTLLEVVLALGIALGLLAVVLFFYQQISKLRDATLSSTAALSAVRLSMDHLAEQLRTACPIPGTFRGGAGDVEFVGSSFADPGDQTGATNGAGVNAAFPTLRIRYSLMATNDSGGGGGLQWTEEPYRADAGSTEDGNATPENAFDTNAESAFADNFGSNSQRAFSESSNLFSGLGLSQTNFTAIGPTNNLVITNSLANSGGVTFSELRYFHLRYWDGTTWLDSWTAENLPRGVEISMGTEAPESDGTPGEFFRRVIDLPLWDGSDNSATNGATDSTSAVGGELQTDGSGEVNP